MSRTARICLVALAVSIGTLQADVGNAQSAGNGCALEAVAGTGRQVLRCEEGLTVTAEGGARFNLIDRNNDGRVDGVALRSKAVLVDVDGSRIGTGFQVVTPQAVAAVRGTQWAVDVKGGVTAVLVVRGRVAVRRSAGGSNVFLGPGEGVDVSSGSEPLVVRRWPAPRAAALLARLGQ